MLVQKNKVFLAKQKKKFCASEKLLKDLSFPYSLLPHTGQV